MKKGSEHQNTMDDEEFESDTDTVIVVSTPKRRNAIKKGVEVRLHDFVPMTLLLEDLTNQAIVINTINSNKAQYLFVDLCDINTYPQRADIISSLEKLIDVYYQNNDSFSHNKLRFIITLPNKIDSLIAQLISEVFLKDVYDIFHVKDSSRLFDVIAERLNKSYRERRDYIQPLYQQALNIKDHHLQPQAPVDLVNDDSNNTSLPINNDEIPDKAIPLIDDEHSEQQSEHVANDENNTSVKKPADNEITSSFTNSDDDIDKQPQLNDASQSINKKHSSNDKDETLDQHNDDKLTNEQGYLAKLLNNVYHKQLNSSATIQNQKSSASMINQPSNDDTPLSNANSEAISSQSNKNENANSANRDEATSLANNDEANNFVDEDIANASHQQEDEIANHANDDTNSNVEDDKQNDDAKIPHHHPNTINKHHRHKKIKKTRAKHEVEDEPTTQTRQSREKQHPQHHFNKKPLVIALLSLIIVGGVGGIGYHVMTNHVNHSQIIPSKSLDYYLKNQQFKNAIIYYPKKVTQIDNYIINNNNVKQKAQAIKIVYDNATTITPILKFDYAYFQTNWQTVIDESKSLKHLSVQRQTMLGLAYLATDNVKKAQEIANQVNIPAFTQRVSTYVAIQNENNNIKQQLNNNHNLSNADKQKLQGLLKANEQLLKQDIDE